MEEYCGQFYEVTAKYDKMTEGGLYKKVSETYSVKATSFADAEMAITEEVAGLSNGEFEITGISPAPYEEVYSNEDGETYYKAKLRFVMIDEVTGKEKYAMRNYLVFAKDLPSALQTMQDVIAKTMAECTTTQISESKVIELIRR